MPAQPKEIVEKILALLDFPATVDEHKLDDGLLLDVKTEESGRLIGRQGQTLADLQYLTNRILFQQDPSVPKVTVDVGGYRLQAREALMKKAQEAADKVRRWGEPVELEALGRSTAASSITRSKTTLMSRRTASKWPARKEKCCCCVRAAERTRFYSTIFRLYDGEKTLLGLGSVPMLL
ncbi:MAG: KH domain-containing protein [Verrucomicrobiales bacterium]|nr:KH domain-containing protein [Verrucomicrobiales bacterium]